MKRFMWEDIVKCNYNFKIAEILHEDHDMPKPEAISSVLTYLKLFRRCPENREVPLEDWRLHLWSESMPEAFKFLTKVAYEHWLNLRYLYLKPAAEVFALLRQLRQRYMMALITNGESASQWEKIHNVNIEKYFDCVLVSGDLPWEKPNPEIFYAACNYLGVEARQCAVIGDKLESDIQGGIEANLGATIWIPLTVTPYGDRLEPQTTDFVPDLVIQSVLDLHDILLPSSSPPSNDKDDDRNWSPEERAQLRPFRSLSTGNAAKATDLDADGNRRVLGKSSRRFAMSLLSDLDSCSSSSSADFS